MILYKKVLFLFLVILTIPSFAQIEDRNFKHIDEYVKKVGALDSLTMGTITDKVTKPFTDKIDKARAIFDWIAYNISYDVKAARSERIDKNSSTEVLLYRKAVGAGFANLFQDMCSSVNIRCLTVNGFTKRYVEDINEKQTEINHSWAVVQLGKSPDEWYYVDVAWASGYTDAALKVFTKSFTDSYFFAERNIFNWQHYPDNLAWKLGPAPKSKNDFFALPLIKEAAYELGLKAFTPKGGYVKTKLNQPIFFNYTLDKNATVSKVSLLIGEGKKQKIKEVNFSFNNGVLNITHQFDTEDAYSITIKVNDKELASYKIEVE